MDLLGRHHRKDITDIFLSAAKNMGAWTPDMVRVALRALSSASAGAKFDWDEAAGEGWGRIIHSREVIAYVCAWLPVVVVREDFAEHLAEALATPPALLVVGSMSDAAFVIDAPTLGALYGWSLPEEFDPQCFSIDDLYCATV